MTNEEARNGGRSVLGGFFGPGEQRGGLPRPTSHVTSSATRPSPYCAPVMFRDEQQARHTLGKLGAQASPTSVIGPRPTFLSILSQATVSLIVYCRPKNQVSRSPRVRQTKSNRSFPFHFICKGRNQQGKPAEPESQSTYRKNPFLCGPWFSGSERWGRR